MWPSTSAGSPDPDPDPNPNPNPNPDPDPSPNPNPKPSPNLSTGSPVRPPSPCRSWWSWCSAWRRGLRRRLRTLDSTTGTMTTRTPTIATRRQTIAPSPCSSTTGSEAMWKAAAQRLRPNRPPARPASAGPGPGRPPASASLGQPRPIHWQICSGWPWPHRPCLPHRSSAVDFPKAFSPAEQLQLTRALPDERTRQQCMLRWIQRLAQPPAADAADAAGAGAAAVVRLAAIARVSSALLGEPLDE